MAVTLRRSCNKAKVFWFFFEKKNQKTFAFFHPVFGIAHFPEIAGIRLPSAFCGAYRICNAR
jgi:hypothetical protein